MLRKIPEKVGCTACVALITKTDIYISNVGDSRCVLTEGMNTYDLSDDHKPENEEETKRITEAGGFVSDGRVNGELSLSRAIGDTYYKQNKNLSVDKQCITCVPEITVRKRKSADSFLVLACDGLWDCLTSAEASTWVREAI